MRNASLSAANRRYRGTANGYRHTKKEEKLKPIDLHSWYHPVCGQHVVSLEVRGVLFCTLGSVQEVRAYMTLRRRALRARALRVT